MKTKHPDIIQDGKSMKINCHSRKEMVFVMERIVQSFIKFRKKRSKL